MSDIHIEKKHNLDLPSARQKAKEWLNAVKNEFNVDAEYEEGTNQDVVHIEKMGVKGKATLDAEKVVFDAKLSFLASAMKGSIQSGIQSGLDKYFG